jgi:ABC-2 type transport system ATP-binding protein
MSSSAEHVLSVKNLKKKLGKTMIIKGISFDIYAGEIFGFLGPNGSGKTTTIRMLVDLIRPTEGTVTVCGLDVHKQHTEALKLMGSIVENPEMYPYMTGWENLEHFARMVPGIGQDRIQEVVDIVGMHNRIHDKVKNYSLGMRQRLGIAQALLGKPKLLIMDEPTNGLDPQGIKELREFIRRLANEGMSLFISSHLLSEIQLMCDRVAIISHGEVIAVGRVDELLEQSTGKVLIHVDSHEKTMQVLESFNGLEVAEAEEIEMAELMRIPNTTILAVRMDMAEIAQLNHALVVAGVNVFAIQVKKPSLEELFLNLTGGESID